LNDSVILQCVDWVYHGFEVVLSIFPGWKFTAADTTAAFALHGRLLLGSQVPTAALGSTRNEILERLSNFKIALFRNSELWDRGTGANVLDSPIKASRHLCDSLEKDE
jgi:2-keto-4-pentenoate hydratase